MKNGKVLGVLGGMGPAAGAEFLRLFTLACPGEKDQDHPMVVMISDTEIPDRSTQILSGENTIGPRLEADFQKLQAMGADLIAVPCNTAHYFINRLEREYPIIHIIEETVKQAKEMSPKGVWLLGTLGTLQSGLYQEEAAKQGLPIYEPSEDEKQLIQACIFEIKANRYQEAGAYMTRVVTALWKRQELGVMLACTELPLAYDATDLPKEKAVSSLQALAVASMKALYE